MIPYLRQEIKHQPLHIFPNSVLPDGPATRGAATSWRVIRFAPISRWSAQNPVPTNPKPILVTK